MNLHRRRDRLAAETLLAEALATLGAPPSDGLQLSRQLRRLANPALARAAAELFDLRVKASGKLAAHQSIFLTAKGLEQSTPSVVAAWRAARVNALTAPRLPVVDLTCGLGSDAAALASVGRPVVAVERDAETALLAGINLERGGGRAVVVRGEAQRPPIRGAHLALIDPDRRPAGRRELDPARWSPPWASVVEHLAGAVGGCAKLAPALDVDAADGSLPADLARRWIWVGLGRELVELGLWTGALAPPGEAPFEVVVLERDGTLRGRVTGSAADRAPLAALAPAAAGDVAWIVEPHAAVIRAGLFGPVAAAVDGAPLGPGLAFLGCGARPAHPLVRRWRVVDRAPADKKRVRAMLRAAGVGPLRIHARGHPEPPARLERAWRGSGDRVGTLVVARLGAGHRVYLVEEA